MPGHYKYNRHDSKRSRSSSDSRHDRSHKRDRNDKWHKKSRSRSRDERRHDQGRHYEKYHFGRDEKRYKPREDVYRQKDYYRKREEQERRSRDERSHSHKYHPGYEREIKSTYQSTHQNFHHNTHHSSKVYKPSNESAKYRKHSDSQSGKSSPTYRKEHKIKKQYEKEAKEQRSKATYVKASYEQHNQSKHVAPIENSSKGSGENNRALPSVTIAKVPSSDQQKSKGQSFNKFNPMKAEYHRQSKKVNNQQVLVDSKPVEKLQSVVRKKSSSAQEPKAQQAQKIKISRFEKLMNQAKANLTFQPPPSSYLALDVYRNLNKFEVEALDARWSAKLKKDLEKVQSINEYLPKPQSRMQICEEPRLWTYIKQQRNEEELQLRLKMEELRIHSSNLLQLERKISILNE